MLEASSVESGDSFDNDIFFKVSSGFFI